MKPDEALELARTLCGAFQQAHDTVVGPWAFAIRDFDYQPMVRAVTKAIREWDRLVSVKRLLGIYYAEKRDARVEAIDRGDVPCEPCRRDGGYRVVPGGTLFPPQSAIPPYLTGYRATDDDGKPAEVVWHGENCCPFHASEASVAYLVRAGTKPLSTPVRQPRRVETEPTRVNPAGVLAALDRLTPADIGPRADTIQG